MTIINPASAPPSTAQMTPPLVTQKIPPARMPPNTYQTPTPIIHIYAQQPGMMQRKMVRENQTDKEQLEGFHEECWNCGQLGHSRKKCPLMGGRGSWHSPFQGPPRGPPQDMVNHWEVQNKGFREAQRILLARVNFQC